MNNGSTYCFLKRLNLTSDFIFSGTSPTLLNVYFNVTLTLSFRKTEEVLDWNRFLTFGTLFLAFCLSVNLFFFYGPCPFRTLTIMALRNLLSFVASSNFYLFLSHLNTVLPSTSTLVFIFCFLEDCFFLSFFFIVLCLL